MIGVTRQALRTDFVAINGAQVQVRSKQLGSRNVPFCIPLAAYEGCVVPAALYADTTLEKLFRILR